MDIGNQYDPPIIRKQTQNNDGVSTDGRRLGLKHNHTTRGSLSARHFLNIDSIWRGEIDVLKSLVVSLARWTSPLVDSVIMVDNSLEFVPPNLLLPLPFFFGWSHPHTTNHKSDACVRKNLTITSQFLHHFNPEQSDH